MKILQALANLIITLLVAHLITGAVPVNAGPPLDTEDPGILDPGQWEVIGATRVSAYGGGDVYQFPILDVSVGIIEDYLQVSAAYSYVISDQDGQGSNSDFGNPELGLKWRFWNSDSWQLAFAPAISFGISRPLAEQGLGDENGLLELPLAVEYTINDSIRLNGSFSYITVENDLDGWGYSLALVHTLNDRWELMGEFVGAADEDFDEEVMDLRAGIDYSITDDFHLLFSIATGIEELNREEKLHYDLYFGLQFFL